MGRSSTGGKAEKVAPPEIKAEPKLSTPPGRYGSLLYLAVGIIIGVSACTLLTPPASPDKSAANCNVEVSKATAVVTKAKAASEAEAAKARMQLEAEIANLQSKVNASAGASKTAKSVNDSGDKAVTAAVKDATAKVTAQFEIQVDKLQKAAKISAAEAKTATKKLSKCEQELGKESVTEAKATASKLAACEKSSAQAVQDSAAEAKAAAKKLSVCEEYSAKAASLAKSTTKAETSADAAKAETAKLQAALKISDAKWTGANDKLSMCDAQIKQLQTELKSQGQTLQAELKITADKLSECKQSKSPNPKPASKSVASKPASKTTDAKPVSKAASKVFASAKVDPTLGRVEVRADGWQISKGALSAQVSVLPMLSNSTIRIPAGTGRIFLEVGPNSHSTMDEEQLQQFDDAFVISFEPLLHHYAALLARRASPDDLRPLGEHHERGLVLPFAVAEVDGVSELRTAGSGDYCASLRQPQNARANNPKCANPSLPLDVRQVPTVRLQTVLSWLAWQGGGGWPIDYLKLDARGLDMEVLRSAGDLLPRVLRVQIDIQGDSCEPMYEGSLTCSDTVKAMREMGYTAAYNRRCGDFDGLCYEDSWEFVRAGIKPLHYRRLPWGKECWHDDMDGLKDKCCTNLYQGLVRGCFNHEYTMHRCCAHKWLPGNDVEPDFV